MRKVWGVKASHDRIESGGQTTNILIERHIGRRTCMLGLLHESERQRETDGQILRDIWADRHADRPTDRHRQRRTGQGWTGQERARSDTQDRAEYQKVLPPGTGPPRVFRMRSRCFGMPSWASTATRECLLARGRLRGPFVVLPWCWLFSFVGRRRRP